MRLFVGHLRGVWYDPVISSRVHAGVCARAAGISVRLAAGFIWGWLLGGILGHNGSGAVASLTSDASSGRGCSTNSDASDARSQTVDHATFRSLVAMRFIPGIPFAVLNYGAGVAGVRIRDFIPSTAIGIIPPMFVFAYCADALFNGSMTEGDAAIRLAIVLVLMLAITLLPVVVKRMLKRETPVAE
jgi:uncharacterized membrane protein YdjX (TVP38/TMEM64 family)